jgi:hypothetical protein
MLIKDQLKKLHKSSHEKCYHQKSKKWNFRLLLLCEKFFGFNFFE